MEEWRTSEQMGDDLKEYAGDDLSSDMMFDDNTGYL